MILFGLAGCSSGVPQEDYDKVVAELDVAQKELKEKDEEILSLIDASTNAFPGCIQFDANNKAYAFKTISGEKTLGIVFCDFDGTNLEREGAIILGYFTAFVKLNVDDIAAYDMDGTLVMTAPNGDVRMAQKYLDLNLADEDVLINYKDELTIILDTVK